MDAIQFVVRGRDGDIRRGVFQDSNGQLVMAVGAGEDVSVNIRRLDAVGYGRDGDALIIVLADGRELRLDSFFDGNNALFLSSDGLLTEVALSDAQGGVSASYQDVQAFGKWSPDDALYFTDGPDDGTIFADAGGVNEQPGMLATGLLTGLGAVGAPGLLGGAAVIGGVGLLGGGDGDSGVTDVTPPEVAITGGVVSVGHVFDGDDHDDGVEIAGTGEPGATITVTIGDVVLDTVVDDDGGWGVVFDPADVPGGEYDVPVEVVATDVAGNSTTIEDVVRLDTETSVTLTEIDGAVASSGTVINADGHSDGVTMSGSGEVGAAITVEVADGPTATTIVGEDGTWSVNFGTDEIAPGAYGAAVTVTAVDAYGNTASASEVMIVDTVTGVSITGNSAGADGVVNAVENAEPTIVTGSAEANASVVVRVAGPDGEIYATQTTQSDGTGAWSVSYPAGIFPAGEYDVTVTAEATDIAGNTASTSATLPIDTLTSVAVTGDNAGPDGVYNADEAAQPVVLTGTAQANASVEVSLRDAGGNVLGQMTVLADGAGDWSADFGAGNLPGGAYEVSATAVATDAAGNMATDSYSFDVDTVADITVNDGGRDDGAVINIVEAGNGVILTGATDPNVEVTVDFAGSTRVVTSDASGQWEAGFAASDIPLGVETTLPITASYTDAAGNTATASGVVDVDTIVRNLSVADATGDAVIDATEAGTGFTLAGTTEEGAQSVTVAFGDGPERAAIVDADGNWTLSFAPGDIPAGEYDTQLTVTTVDRNDNVDSITSAVTVDTDLPEAPVVIRYTEYTRGDPGVSGIGTDVNDDITGISQITHAGAVSDVDYVTTELPIGEGELLFSFEDRIPNGSNLVVETQDGVGNENSTLVVMEEGAADATSSGLAQFDIGAIDLSITDQSILTLTEADLLAMSGASDTLVVHGDGNDVVNAAGAIDTGETELIGGQVYSVYTMGEGSLIVDSDISVNPII